MPISDYINNSNLSYILHYIDNELLIASRGRSILIRCHGKDKLFNLRIPIVKQLISLFSLSRRMFRCNVHHAIRLKDDKIFVIGFGIILVLDLMSGLQTMKPMPGLGKRPLFICAKNKSQIFYGEYFNNKERTKVHIYNSEGVNLDFQSIWEFSGIRHVHGVFYDPYENKVWITTGDTDEESGIWATCDEFQTLEKVIGGTQQVRTIQLLFSEKYVYFGSDTPLEKNFIYRMERSSGRIEKLQEVGSSVFWGCKVRDDLFFSTVVEPSSVNTTRCACIWGSHDGQKWKCIARFKKDIWPMKLFQYGQIFFPAGVNESNKLWFTPWATEQHYTTQYIDITKINWD